MRLSSIKNQDVPYKEKTQDSSFFPPKKIKEKYKESMAALNRGTRKWKICYDNLSSDVWSPVLTANKLLKRGHQG